MVYFLYICSLHHNMFFFYIYYFLMDSFGFFYLHFTRTKLNLVHHNSSSNSFLCFLHFYFFQYFKKCSGGKWLFNTYNQSQTFHLSCTVCLRSYRSLVKMMKLDFSRTHPDLSLRQNCLLYNVEQCEQIAYLKLK